MKIFYSIKDFLDHKLEINTFIPTMGNLHNGHMSLIEHAKKYSDIVCVSIYVNEDQFTEKKDFDSYPKSINEDISMLEKSGVTYLLLPEKHDINFFSKPFDIKLEPTNLTLDLCGKSRPGHFLAVMDILHRFFQIIKPKHILLGEKDFQQILVISELIKIYNYKINLISSPIVRDNKGLALSSRNSHLTNEEKIIASDIYKNLLLAKKMFDSNISINEIIDEIYRIFDNSPIKLEYFTIRDSKTLQQGNDSDLIALLAAYVGKIRLIDNIFIRSDK